jgi:5,5'-dehydrodivanillate O-demethylase oxygenase subunit
MVMTRAEATSAERAAAYTDFAHTGPGTLAGRYLRRFWQPVYEAARLAPGHAKPLHIMSEDFTLYRGEDGAPHVVAPRCAHRGTQLSTGWVEGECLRCFYHGWKYDHTGQCVEMPAEEASFPSKVRIASYPTREHLGLIFAYLGDGDAPPFPPYPPFQGEGVLEANAELFLCNYFQDFENSADEVHVSFVHREGGSHQGIYDLPRITAEETDYGMVRFGTRAGGDVRVTHHFWPNTTRVIIPPMAGMEGVGGWREIYLTFVPVDDTQHYAFLAGIVRVTGAAADAYLAQRERFEAACAAAPSSSALAAEVLAGQRRVADTRHPELVIFQDKVAQTGQGAIQDRTRERLGRSDTAVILLRKLFARELEALATGRPLKQWRGTAADVVPTLGF